MSKNSKSTLLSRILPALDWLGVYGRHEAGSDLLAAIIVTIMLIPQSLAYALLAGLPAQIGLYASIAPLIGYAVFGSSRVLAVGPVAVVSLMTAAAIGEVAVPGSADYLAAALVLALLSGLFLILMGIFRLGFLANLLSHPVISGFITASGIVIAASQAKHIFGIEAEGHSLLSITRSLVQNMGDLNLPTVMIGFTAIAFLFGVRSAFVPVLKYAGVPTNAALMASRAGPIMAVFVSIGAIRFWDLDQAGVQIVGAIPQGLPGLTVPVFDVDLWQQLLPAAILISIIGFVESVSVGQTLAAKRRQRIHPDQELIGLGSANIAAAFSGGYPVTGGFARSVVNFDAGARTPMAGVFTAIGIALTALFFTPVFYDLPKATLAATIIVAVISLVDVGALKRTWIYSRTDFSAMAATILATLVFGVEEGVVAGVTLSLALHIWRTSRPHYAIVGQVPGTEHFRNILRHDVRVSDHVLSVRTDESLYFANARYLEDKIFDLLAEKPKVTDVVLMCSAVNVIDGSALESLTEINDRLYSAGVVFHLSEVKGPVMDRLKRTNFLDSLTGQVFLSQYQAIRALDPLSLQSNARLKTNNDPAA